MPQQLQSQKTMVCTKTSTTVKYVIETDTGSGTISILMPLFYLVMRMNQLLDALADVETSMKMLPGVLSIDRFWNVEMATSYQAMVITVKHLSRDANMQSKMLNLRAC